MSTPDLEHAAYFLDLLGRPSWTFQTFDDDPSRREARAVAAKAARDAAKAKDLPRDKVWAAGQKAGRDHYAHIMHGTLAEHAAELTRLNAAGAGIFVTVNQTDGRGRKADNVVAVRAAFMDLDGGPLKTCLAQLDEVGLKPHIIVRSSGTDHCHPYLLTRDLPLDQFSDVQRALAEMCDSDPTVSDLPRVLRLPGFWHRKGEPVMVRVESVSDHPPYGLDAFAAPLKRVELERAKMKPRAPGEVSGWDNDLALLCVAHIRNNERFVRRDPWIGVGNALHHATGGSEEGLQAFIDFTGQIHGDADEVCEEVWRGLKPTRTGVQKLVALAKEDGLDHDHARHIVGERIVADLVATARAKCPDLLAQWRAEIKRREAAGVIWRQLHPRHDVRVEHFHAYQPKDNFIFTPNGDLWVARTVIKFLGDMGAFHHDGSPVMIKQEATTDKTTGEVVEHEEQDTMPCHVWLERFRPVQAFSWVPGEPEIIRNRLAVEAGWRDHPGARVFNQYHAPTIVPGDPAKAELWVQFGRELLLPQDAERFFDCMAFKRRYPGIKINRIIDLLGQPRIGKDALLQPVRVAVGTPNYSVINPGQLLGRFNGFRKSVILQVSEQHAPGSAFAKFDKYDFYEHTKDYGAAPPDMLRVDEKNRGEYYVSNCALLVVLSNNPLSAFYLPAEDGRHDVMLSPQPRGWKPQSFFNELFAYYENGGCNHIAAWLDQRDLSAFNPKAPPPHTEAFYGIVNATRPPEAARLDDVLDSLGRPGAVTLTMIRTCEPGDDYDFTHWLIDRKFRGQIPHRFDDCGYTVVLSSRADKLWVVDGKRQAIYGRKDVPDDRRRKAAETLEREGLEAALKRIDEEMAQAAAAAAAAKGPPPPPSWRTRKTTFSIPGRR